MCSIVHQSRNIIFRHFRQLFLEDTFQTGEDDVGVVTAVVVDHSELDFAVALFDDSRLGCVRGVRYPLLTILRTFSGNGTTLGASLVSSRSSVGDCEDLMRLASISSSGEPSAFLFVAI